MIVSFDDHYKRRIHGGLSQELRELAIDKTITLPAGANRSSMHRLAKYVGIKISYRKQDDGSLIIRRAA